MKMHTLLGCVTVELTSADCTGLLNTLTAAGVQMHDVCIVDELSITVVISKHQLHILERITKKLGVSVKVKRRFGLYWTARAMLMRPVLVAFFLMVLFLSFYLPSRVLFFFVEGNTTVPTKQILEAAEECGIRFGARRVEVRSEMMKNALLEKMPQLQWAGINTIGCTATISVRERTIQQEAKSENKGVCSIVASRDGIIRNCTVYSGNPLCSVGQAVKEGQLLVSGYLDLGIVTQGTRAEAEISALTFRSLDVLALNAQCQRGDVSAVETLYSIRIGKKLIKLYKDSGNLDTTCAKIYTEEYLSLPGGFQLPVSIITERMYHYKNSDKTVGTVNENHWLDAYAQAYLKEKMIAGQIVSAESEILADDSVSRLSGQYACIEQIGKTRPEQLPKDG